MKYFLLVFAIALSVSVKAQTHLVWSTPEVTPNSQVNDFKAMNTDAHGNTYVINFTQSNFNSYFTYRFFAYNNIGVKMWQYNNDSCFTNCQDIYKYIIPVDNAGALFIGTYNDLGGNNQIRIKRIDINGNLMWQKYWQYNRLSPLYPLVCRLDNAGNLIIGFSAFGHPDFSENFAFAKFDTIAGNELWHFEMPDQGPSGVTLDESMKDIAVDANNNIYVTADASNPFVSIFKKYYFSLSTNGVMNYFGSTNFSSIDNSPHQILEGNDGAFYRLLNFNNTTVVFKQDTSGGFFQWTVNLAHDSANFKSIALSKINNELYVLSNYNYFIPDSSFAGGFNTNFHYSVTKIDTAGNMLWQKDYFSSFDSLSQQNAAGGATGFLACNNHLYVMSDGYTDSVSLKMLLHKIDTAGNTVWYYTTSTGPAGPIANDIDCNIYVSRSTQPQSGGYYYCLTQKFSEVPLSFNLLETKNSSLLLFPNPAFDQLTIKMPSGNKQTHTLIIINTLGQKIYNSRFYGNNTSLSVNKFNKGIYFVNICYEDGLTSKSKLLVK